MPGTTLRPEDRKCQYCDEPLTWNEFDDEPGGPPGFFSAHFRCVHEQPDGRFEVVRDRGVYVEVWSGDYPDATRVAPASRRAPGFSKRYSTFKRARAEAISLARSNHGGAFAVLDLERSEEVFSAPCQLPAPDPRRLFERERQRAYDVIGGGNPHTLGTPRPEPDVDPEPVRTWVDATSCIAVTADRDGLWVATRESPTDMWSPPEPLKRADGPDPHFEHPREASSHADRERDPA